jgi:hypothetical protein
VMIQFWQQVRDRHAPTSHKRQERCCSKLNRRRKSSPGRAEKDPEKLIQQSKYPHRVGRSSQKAVKTFRNYLPCFPAPTLATEGYTTMPDKGRGMGLNNLLPKRSPVGSTIRSPNESRNHREPSLV